MITLYIAFNKALAIARQQNNGWKLSLHLVESQPQCLAVDPLHPHIIFCGTFDQGLW